MPFVVKMNMNMNMTQDAGTKNKNTPQYGLILSGMVVSAFTAVMLILAFHPHNQWYFSFIALVPMLYAQHKILPVKWSGLASATGIGGWLFIFLTEMFAGNPAGRVIQIIVIVIILIDFFAVPGIVKFHRQTNYRFFILHGITEWVGIEMIRSFIPPINTHAFIAQTMYTKPFMLLPISVFSIYGLGLVILLVNFVLAHGVMFPGRRSGYRWGLSAGIILLIWIGISVVISSTAPKDVSTIRVAAVQHNYPLPGHQDSEESQMVRFQVLREQAFEASRQGAELIVMPELALGFDPLVKYTSEFKSLAAETNAYLLIGYGINDPKGWRNEMVMLTPDGQFLDVYGKNHPTSPGEPHIISSGVYPVYETSFGPVATLICNDVHYTDVSRILAGKGARLIAVPTLEAPGIALEQVAQSVMRAVENRVAIVKADVAYASAIIDPYGRIKALKNASPEGGAFALVADVPLVKANTIFGVLGDWVGWLALGGFIFFMFLQIKTARRNKQATNNEMD